MGDLFSSHDAQIILKDALMGKLISLIETSAALNPRIKKQYSTLDEIITYSKLREAPALGAGVDAFLNYQNFQLS